MSLERKLKKRLELCSYDELRVVDVILARLELGRQRYGALDLSQPRDWAKERAEELLDAHVYAACELISKQDKP